MYVLYTHTVTKVYALLLTPDKDYAQTALHRTISAAVLVEDLMLLLALALLPLAIVLTTFNVACISPGMLHH